LFHFNRVTVYGAGHTLAIVLLANSIRQSVLYAAVAFVQTATHLCDGHVFIVLVCVYVTCYCNVS